MTNELACFAADACRWEPQWHRSPCTQGRRLEIPSNCREKGLRGRLATLRRSKPEAIFRVGQRCDILPKVNGFTRPIFKSDLDYVGRPEAGPDTAGTHSGADHYVGRGPPARIGARRILLGTAHG
jgi:hypothetical protein